VIHYPIRQKKENHSKKDKTKGEGNRKAKQKRKRRTESKHPQATPLEKRRKKEREIRNIPALLFFLLSKDP